MQGEELTQFIVDTLDDMKARDLTVLDVREVTTVTDTMIIASGTSSRHVNAVASHLVRSIKNAGVAPAGIEGEEGSEWILVDLGGVVVHVMSAETRAHYNLEKLWNLEENDPAARPTPLRRVASGDSGSPGSS